MVAPFCRNVLTNASNFFDEFLDLYESPEDLLDEDNLDILVDSTEEIVKGFEICKKMHGPVTKEANANVIKGAAVV